MRGEAFEERVDAVLELRFGDDALVHHVGLDEEARRAGRGHQGAPGVGQTGRHGPAALDGVEDDAVHGVGLEQRQQRAILEEHAVHRVAHADQRAFGEAAQRVGQVVLEVEVGAARREPQVRGVDEHAAPLREQLGEAAEDRIARHADEQQPVAFAVHRADPVRRLVLELLHQIVEEGPALRRAAEGVVHPEVDRPFGERAEDRRPPRVQREHAAPGAVHRVGVIERLAQPVDVEPAAAHLLADADQLLDLPLDVGAVGREGAVVAPGARGARARDVDGDRRHVVHPLPDLGPLDVGVAGVGEHGQRRRRHPAHRMGAAPELDGDVGLHVAADVGRVAVVLGFVQVLVRDMAHGRLQRVDLGKADRQIEGADQLREAAHHEDVGDRLAARGSGAELVEPPAEERGPGRHAASDQPAVSRVGHVALLVSRTARSRRTSPAASADGRSSSSIPRTRSRNRECAARRAPGRRRPARRAPARTSSRRR